MRNTRNERLQIAGIATIFVALRLCIAWMTLEFESIDFTVYLQEWYNTIHEAGGFTALRHQVGDYGILYQSIICLMTYLPLSAISCYKLLSLLFDIVLALVCGRLAQHLSAPSDGGHRYDRFVFVFIAVLYLPTVVLDSSLWAQCDSIYTAFAMIALLFLCRGNDAVAFLWLGVALSFKLQTVFILPAFLFIAFTRKRLHYLILSLVTFYAASIPGFLAGRSLLSPLEIYLGQTGTYKEMYLSYPSIWVLIGADYKDMGDVAIVYTVAILASFMLYLCYQHRRGNVSFTPDRIVEIACLLSWTCVEFLPSMHDRYSYMVEILLVILISTNRKYILCLIPEEILILLRYRAFLFNGMEGSVPTDAEASLYLMTYILFVFLTWNRREACHTES